MADDNESTGFPENTLQPHFLRTLSENRGSTISDQAVPEAMEALNRFSTFSDFEDNDERETDINHNLVVETCDRNSCKNSWDGQGPERNATTPARRQSAQDNARDLTQFNGALDNNITGDEGTEGRYQIPGGRQNSPQDNLRVGANPVGGLSSLKDNCNPKVVIPSPRGSPQFNVVDNNLTAGEETGERQNRSTARYQSAVNGQGVPEDNCNPRAVTPPPRDSPTEVTSPPRDNPQLNSQGRQTENDAGAVGFLPLIQNHQNGGDPQTIRRNLNDFTDQTCVKLVVNMDKIPGKVLNRPPPAVQHGPRHDNRENIRPLGFLTNNISTQTQNIPVTPQNTGRNKLVRKCTKESLEYLNDHLLPFYGKNWKHIASHHGWNNERIGCFCYKNDHVAFEKMIFEKEFSVYKVQNLLDDLTSIERIDLIADYPGEWS